MWGLILILVLLIPLLAIVLDSQVGRALARRIEGPGVGESARVAALEAEVDRLSRELDRVSEETEFLSRLLEAGRGESGEGGPLPPGAPRG